MKTFLRKLAVAVAVMLAAVTVTGVVQGETAYAAKMGTEERCKQTFLGMVSWDCHVTEESWQGGENAIVRNITTIGANILNDMLAIASYLALGFVVYGGYLYIFASGDVAKTQNGKKTLTRAFIGLAIVASAKVIVNSMHIAFLGSSGAFQDCVTEGCVTAEELVDNALGWFIGTASAVAFIYIVIGGVSYATAAGDPGKLQKAKNTIIYAVIGLIVCALAQGIVRLFIDTANNASEAYYSEKIIAKEENAKILD